MSAYACLCHMHVSSTTSCAACMQRSVRRCPPPLDKYGRSPVEALPGTVHGPLHCAPLLRADGGSPASMSTGSSKDISSSMQQSAHMHAFAWCMAIVSNMPLACTCCSLLLQATAASVRLPCALTTGLACLTWVCQGWPGQGGALPLRC